MHRWLGAIAVVLLSAAHGQCSSADDGPQQQWEPELQKVEAALLNDPGNKVLINLKADIDARRAVPHSQQASTATDDCQLGLMAHSILSLLSAAGLSAHETEQAKAVMKKNPYLSTCDQTKGEL